MQSEKKKNKKNFLAIYLTQLTELIFMNIFFFSFLREKYFLYFGLLGGCFCVVEFYLDMDFGMGK